MKAMTPESFWALAYHLQNCQHKIKIVREAPALFRIRLSSGDVLHGSSTMQPMQLPSENLAIAICEANRITLHETIDEPVQLI
jgi:hypothetical protein